MQSLTPAKEQDGAKCLPNKCGSAGQLVGLLEEAGGCPVKQLNIALELILPWLDCRKRILVKFPYESL